MTTDKPISRTVTDIEREIADLGLTDEVERELAALEALRPEFIPGLGVVSGLAAAMLNGAEPFRKPRPDTKCYRADAGFMVHVKPDCRCGEYKWRLRWW